MARIVVEMTGDEAKLWASMQKIVAQQQKQEQGFRKVEASGQRAARSIERSSGRASRRIQDGTAAVSKWTAGFLSLGTAIAATTGALRALEQARTQAGQTGQESERGLSRLAQLAAGDTGKLKTLVAAARQTVREGGAKTLDEAASTVFEIESAGLLAERRFFSRLNPIEDAGTVARSAGILRSALGKGETGTIQNIVSKGIAAATPVTGVGFGDILEGAALPAAAAKTLGLTDEEILAATSVTAQATGSGQVGGNQVSSLLTSFIKQGFGEEFKGKPLTEMIAAVREKDLSDAELVKFLGRKEAFRAFKQLTPDAFEPRLAEIKQGQADNLAEKVIRSAAAVPEIEAARQARIASGQESLTEIDKGIVRNRSEAILDRQEAARRATGETSEFGNQMFRFFGKVDRFFRGDEDFTTRMDRMQREGVDRARLRREAPAEFFQAAKAMERAADRMADSIDAIPKPQTLVAPNEDAGQ